MSALTVADVPLKGRDTQTMKPGLVSETLYPFDGEEPWFVLGPVYGWEGDVQGWTLDPTAGDTLKALIGTEQTITFALYAMLAMITNVTMAIQALRDEERYVLTVSYIGGVPDESS
jgi:hypothetical protein